LVGVLDVTASNGKADCEHTTKPRKSRQPIPGRPRFFAGGVVTVVLPVTGAIVGRMSAVTTILAVEREAGFR
jgi:hypothetical protein